MAAKETRCTEDCDVFHVRLFIACFKIYYANLPRSASKFTTAPCMGGKVR